MSPVLSWEVGELEVPGEEEVAMEATRLTVAQASARQCEHRLLKTDFFARRLILYLAGGSAEIFVHFLISAASFWRISLSDRYWYQEAPTRSQGHHQGLDHLEVNK